MPVYHLYFSPCSSTYDTTYAFCRAISQNAAIEVNLTDRETEVPEIPAGSVAVVAAHVFVPDLERGRPDENDFAEIRDFGRRVCEKYAAGDESPVVVPGNRPYRPAYKAAFVPETDTAMCRKCGVCIAACPTGAIDAQDPSKTDINLCINCMRCVASCASGAKAQPAAAKAAITARLSPLLGGHKPNEFYL